MQWKRRNQRVIGSVVVILISGVAVALLAGYEYTPVAPAAVDPPASVESEGAPSTTTTVRTVIDGDTLVIADGTFVRLIGIDTPERDEFYYETAKTALTTMVEDQVITLVRDTTDQDQYGRLLRYVYVDETFVNLELVAAGHARVVWFAPDVAQYDQLREAAVQARAAGLGIWAE